MKVELTILLIVILIVIIFFGWHRGVFNPTKCTSSNSTDNLAKYNKKEIIVFHKDSTPAQSRVILLNFFKDKYLLSEIKITYCGGCDSLIELWELPDTNTRIHPGGLASGTGPGIQSSAGEDSIFIYARNFEDNFGINNSVNNLNDLRRRFATARQRTNIESKQDTIKIAVLDTGIDTTLFLDHKTLWKNSSDTCYDNNIHGYNFLEMNNNIYDGEAGRHGTMVSNLILKEFTKSDINYPQIMCLKTHDNNGNGTLFANACAILFAMKKDVDIINASWGFYNIKNDAFRVINSIITDSLKERGILFIAAAGNQIAEEDKRIRAYYREEHAWDILPKQIRNITYNHFYPASLSENSKNNVITVTTCSRSAISRKQNNSDAYVDLAVHADSSDKFDLGFNIPFVDYSVLLKGTSFAAPVVAGKIGSWLPKREFTNDINKRKVFRSLITTYPNLTLIDRNRSLSRQQLVRGGRFVRTSR